MEAEKPFNTLNEARGTSTLPSVEQGAFGQPRPADAVPHMEIAEAQAIADMLKADELFSQETKALRQLSNKLDGYRQTLRNYEKKLEEFTNELNQVKSGSTTILTNLSKYKSETGVPQLGIPNLEFCTQDQAITVYLLLTDAATERLTQAQLELDQINVDYKASESRLAELQPQTSEGIVQSKTDELENVYQFGGKSHDPEEVAQLKQFDQIKIVNQPSRESHDEMVRLGTIHMKHELGKSEQGKKYLRKRDIVREYDRQQGIKAKLEAYMNKREENFRRDQFQLAKLFDTNDGGKYDSDLSKKFAAYILTGKDSMQKDQDISKLFRTAREQINILENTNPTELINYENLVPDIDRHSAFVDTLLSLDDEGIRKFRAEIPAQRGNGDYDRIYEYARKHAGNAMNGMDRFVGNIGRHYNYYTNNMKLAEGIDVLRSQSDRLAANLTVQAAYVGRYIKDIVSKAEAEFEITKFKDLIEGDPIYSAESGLRIIDKEIENKAKAAKKAGELYTECSQQIHNPDSPVNPEPEVINIPCFVQPENGVYKLRSVAMDKKISEKNQEISDAKKLRDDLRDKRDALPMYKTNWLGSATKEPSPAYVQANEEWEKQGKIISGDTETGAIGLTQELADIENSPENHVFDAYNKALESIATERLGGRKKSETMRDYIKENIVNAADGTANSDKCCAKILQYLRDVMEDEVDAAAVAAANNLRSATDKVRQNNDDRKNPESAVYNLNIMNTPFSIYQEYNEELARKKKEFSDMGGLEAIKTQKDGARETVNLVADLEYVPEEKEKPEEEITPSVEVPVDTSAEVPAPSVPDLPPDTVPKDFVSVPIFVEQELGGPDPREEDGNPVIEQSFEPTDLQENPPLINLDALDTVENTDSEASASAELQQAIELVREDLKAELEKQPSMVPILLKLFEAPDQVSALKTLRTLCRNSEPVINLINQLDQLRGLAQ